MHKLLGLLVLGLAFTLSFGAVGCKKDADKEKKEKEVVVKEKEKEKKEKEAVDPKKATITIEEFTLMEIKDAEIDKEGKATGKLKIKRGGTGDPAEVEIDFAKIEGVKIEASPAKIAKDKTEADITVTITKIAAAHVADMSGKMKEHDVKVMVKSGDAKDDKTTKLKVTKK